MPHHKSCVKRLKQAARAKIRNTAVKSAFRRNLKDMRAKVTAGETIDLSAAYTTIDKVKGKGLIHKNKASRIKSRLAKAAAKKIPNAG